MNGALLVRGDDGSEEIKFRKDRYLTTVKIEGRGATTKKDTFLTFWAAILMTLL